MDKKTWLFALTIVIGAEMALLANYFLHLGPHFAQAIGNFNDQRREFLDHHIEQKRVAVEAVRAGRLSIEQAAGIFARLHREQPICSSKLLREQFAPDEPTVSMNEIFRRQVHAFLEARDDFERAYHSSRPAGRSS